MVVCERLGYRPADEAPAEYVEFFLSDPLVAYLAHPRSFGDCPPFEHGRSDRRGERLRAARIDPEYAGILLEISDLLRAFDSPDLSPVRQVVTVELRRAVPHIPVIDGCADAAEFNLITIVDIGIPHVYLHTLAPAGVDHDMLVVPLQTPSPQTRGVAPQHVPAQFHLQYYEIPELRPELRGLFEVIEYLIFLPAPDTARPFQWISHWKNVTTIAWNLQ
jgi:hypothetical protein